MKISIIVPVYNVEKYLKKCLDSLVNQKYTNYEIVIVNDGSTDNSQDIIDKYIKKYPKLIKSYKKKNGGLSSARNYGINKSTGDYLLFVDSDDYLQTNSLKLLSEKLVKEKSDIIVFDINTVYPNYSIVKKTMTDEDNVKRYIVGEPSACNKLVKKDIFINNNIKFMENVFYEDLATMPLLALYTDKISFLNKPLYNYVQRENSIMNQTKCNPKMFTLFQVIDYITEKFNGKYDEELEYLYITHLLRTASMRFVIFEETKEYLNKINSIMKNKYPNFTHNKYYKKCSFKYKLVCNLSYHKLYGLLKLLMRVKGE